MATSGGTGVRRRLRRLVVCAVLGGSLSAPGAAGAVTLTYTSSTPISIPSSGAATPYPSTLDVSAFPDAVGKVTVTLHGFTHTWPSDVNVLLVSPLGVGLVLMQDIGDGQAVSGIELRFDDAGGQWAGGPLLSGSYHPAGVAPNVT